MRHLRKFSPRVRNFQTLRPIEVWGCNNSSAVHTYVQRNISSKGGTLVLQNRWKSQLPGLFV